MYNEIITGFIFYTYMKGIIKQKLDLKKIVHSTIFLLKLFSCAIIFRLICHEKMQSVEGERSRENFFETRLIQYSELPFIYT